MYSKQEQRCYHQYMQQIFTKHYSDSTLVNASENEVFNFIDNHSNLSSHMSKSSWMMGGGKMDTSTDDGKGQRVGSHIILKGQAFGIPISLNEVVTRYEPPHLKIWETVGEIKLLIIGHYRMGVTIEDQENNQSRLEVSIEYNLPSKNQWLGKLFGDFYAKWCVSQMLQTVKSHFIKSS